MTRRPSHPSGRDGPELHPQEGLVVHVLPGRDLMALAELGGGRAVQPQGLGQRAMVLGRIELNPGAEVAISVIPPIPTA